MNQSAMRKHAYKVYLRDKNNLGEVRCLQALARKRRIAVKLAKRRCRAFWGGKWRVDKIEKSVRVNSIFSLIAPSVLIEKPVDERKRQWPTISCKAVSL